MFLLDGSDITEEIKINKISTSEYTVIYLPENSLTEGVHKVEIKFTDTSNQEVSKSWTFTISPKEGDPDSFEIFGYYINKRVALIIAGGIALVVLAILTPVIIFAVWKDNSEGKNEKKPTLPPTLPTIRQMPIYTKPEESPVENSNKNGTVFQLQNHWNTETLRRLNILTWADRIKEKEDSSTNSNR